MERLVESGDVMARALGQYLNKIIVDVNAGMLKEEEHEIAFTNIFQDVLLFVKGFLNNDLFIELRSKHKLSSELLREIPNGKNYHTYEISSTQFWQFLDKIAKDIYYSEDYETKIIVRGSVDLEILVVCDPIYFSIDR